MPALEATTTVVAPPVEPDAMAAPTCASSGSRPMYWRLTTLPGISAL